MIQLFFFDLLDLALFPVIFPISSSSEFSSLSSWMIFGFIFFLKKFLKIKKNRNITAAIPGYTYLELLKEECYPPCNN